MKRGHITASLFAQPPNGISQWATQSLQPSPGMRVLSTDELDDGPGQRQADQNVQGAQ